MICFQVGIAWIELKQIPGLKITVTQMVYVWICLLVKVHRGGLLPTGLPRLDSIDQT